VASPDGRDGSVTIHADASIRAASSMAPSASSRRSIRRTTYVHMARGSVLANGQRLNAGDAARIEGEAALVLEGGADAEVLVFDLAPN
jgi:redox-sensitive bicupin YhaK (pirin superfamily)